MCKLEIKQEPYNTVEFEFKSVVDAAIMIEQLRPYASIDTKFTINCKEGEEDGI